MHMTYDAPAPQDPVRGPAAAAGPGTLARNADFAWDRFPADEYCAHNYTTLRVDDSEILDLVARWFSRTVRSRRLAGLDVGTGPNLYPALSMLPHCDSITLREHSATNVAWLREAAAALPEQWDPFWQVVTGPDAVHGDFAHAAAALAERAVIEQGSVFELPAAAWDLGTMFFVAESISQDPAEFTAAVTTFVRAVKPGGPFAAAFMESSEGYEVADIWFPATAVGEPEITKCLDQVAEDLTVRRVEVCPAPLRDGYTGMIVATGRAL